MDRHRRQRDRAIQQRAAQLTGELLELLQVHQLVHRARGQLGEPPTPPGIRASIGAGGAIARERARRTDPIVFAAPHQVTLGGSIAEQLLSDRHVAAKRKALRRLPGTLDARTAFKLASTARRHAEQVSEQAAARRRILQGR